MKIAEMEAHHDQFIALESRIRGMVDSGEFPAVFSVCEESFGHIVPEIKYRKKKEIKPETPSLVSFQVIRKYAAPLFEHPTIKSFFEFVKSTRVLAKHENNYLQLAEEVLECEEMARVLWNELERQPGFLQRNIRGELGVDQDIAVDILKTWEQLGLIIRQPDNQTYRLYLRSRFNATVAGICQTCGKRGMGRKEEFLKPIVCSGCGTEDYCHLVCAEQE